MRMVPDRPRDTGSRAEGRVFDRLRRALDEHYVAYHSVRPRRHPTKRFPEIDFVVCGPRGLLVLEVKGGRVSRRADGLWEFRDRRERVHTSSEGPFRQAKSALEGLTDELRLNGAFASGWAIGYGVVFPDCAWEPNKDRRAPELITDLARSRGLDRWLDDLYRYWAKRHDGKGRILEENALNQIHAYLQGLGERRPPVPSPPPEPPLPPRRPPILHLTEDQARVMTAADAAPRVLCSGGAGTGKTAVAERIAQRWAHAGRRVAVVCQSSWLRHYLMPRLSVPRVSVSLIAGARLDCRRAGLERFDALIVDDGHDLYDRESLTVLDGVLAGGLREGRWCWFQDPNLMRPVGNRSEARNRVESIAQSRVDLRTHCRSTSNILEWTRDRLRVDLGTGGIGPGPVVRHYTASGVEDSVDRLVKELAEVKTYANVGPSSVTILSPKEVRDSSVSALPSDLLTRIQLLDSFAMRRRHLHQAGFARIAEFRGLESDVVLVVDLPAARDTPQVQAAGYVAFTRARRLLSVIELDD